MRIRRTPETSQEGQVINIDARPRPSRRRSAAVLAGSTLMGTLGGGVLMSICERNGGVEVTRQGSVKKLAVQKIEPVAFDIRARTVASGESQANRNVRLNLGLFKVDTASDQKMNTVGQVETLTGANTVGVRVVLGENGTQNIYVPVSSIELFSRIVRDKTTTTGENDKFADFGQMVASGLDVVGIGGPNSNINAAKANISSASEALLVNKVQEICGPATWHITKDVITEGYKMAAVSQNIDPAKVRVVFEPSTGEPDFTGPWQLPAGYEYEVNGPEKCKVAKGAYVPAVKPDQQLPAGAVGPVFTQGANQNRDEL